MAGHVKTHRGLTTDGVVEAALQIADDGGIEALSIRRLATVLGVTPMAIYRHVRDKGHLLDLMADRLIGQLDPHAADAGTWQDELRSVATNLLTVVGAHPAAPLLLARPFDSPAALRMSERMLAILARAGFGPAESVRLLQVLTGMLLGPAIHRVTYRQAWREQPKAPADQGWDSQAPAAAEFPYLSAVTDQLIDWSAGLEDDGVTIEVWVGGVEALALQRGRTSPAAEPEPE